VLKAKDDELDKAKAELGRLEERAKEDMDENRELRGEMERLREEKGKLGADLKEVESMLGSKQREWEVEKRRTEEEMESVVRERDAERHGRGDAEARLSAARELADDVCRQLQEMGACHSLGMSDAEVRFEEYEERVCGLEGRLKVAEEVEIELETVKKLLEGVTRRAEAAAERGLQLEEENKALQEEIEETKRRNEEANNLLKDERDLLAVKLCGVEAAAASSDAAACELRAALEREGGRADELEARLQGIQEQVCACVRACVRACIFARYCFLAPSHIQRIPTRISKDSMLQTRISKDSMLQTRISKDSMPKHTVAVLYTQFCRTPTVG
jgi:chromosome segregation ATPase